MVQNLINCANNYWQSNTQPANISIFHYFPSFSIHNLIGKEVGINASLGSIIVATNQGFLYNIKMCNYYSPHDILHPSQNPARFVISCGRPSVCVSEVSLQQSSVRATNAQLDIMTCKSASGSWPCFTSTHLLQLHLPAQSGGISKRNPHFITICFGGSYLNLAEGQADAFKREKFTVCVLHVFTVLLYVCLHVGGHICLAIRLFSSLGEIFTYLTFA